jgi:hypothetical protein
MRSEYAGHLAKTIRLLPPGPVSTRQSTRLREWIDWSGERCLIANCPFPPAVLQRLTSLARAKAPSRKALDGLLRGRLEDAAAIERRSLATRSPNDWVPYLLLKAKILGESGRTAQAERVLTQLTRTASRDALIEYVSRQLATKAPAPVQRVDTGWSGTNQIQRREVLAAEPLAQFEIRFEKIGDGGATVEARINHSLAGFHAIGPGAILRLDVEPPSDYVLVELIREAGAAFRPSDSL